MKLCMTDHVFHAVLSTVSPLCSNFRPENIFPPRINPDSIISTMVQMERNRENSSVLGVVLNDPYGTRATEMVQRMGKKSEARRSRRRGKVKDGT